MPEIDVKQKVLAANQEAAAALRESFRDQRTLVVNLISSPGSGKTTLLEATVARLSGRLKMGGLDGDIATERDADRLRKAGIPARQILTGGACHLDARQVDAALVEEGEKLRGLDILFIENVGNLICPTSYDLGEDFKIVLLSTAEGDDKPFKYPAIFSKAKVTVLTKVDLLPYVDFDVAAVKRQVGTLNPGARLLEVSARTGDGMDDWCALPRASSGTRGHREPPPGPLARRHRGRGPLALGRAGRFRRSMPRRQHRPSSTQPSGSMPGAAGEACLAAAEEASRQTQAAADVLLRSPIDPAAFSSASGGASSAISSAEGKCGGGGSTGEQRAMEEARGALSEMRALLSELSGALSGSDSASDAPRRRESIDRHLDAARTALRG
ncbi:MAG: hydrogenase nickel incorporation protein HypB [Holophagales bacterium]|nr:hydrogenase nickel incorporation protein HypB [Holophagales bacterium]